MTTLDDDLAVKTAPAGSRRNGPKHAPRRKPKRQRQKGFKGWLSRWWWVFVIVPVAGAILILLTLLYVYSQLELPKTPPPLQTTYVYGDGLRHENGRVWPLDVGLSMAADRPGSWCYVVEVCTTCQWNHLHEAFVARAV